MRKLLLILIFGLLLLGACAAPTTTPTETTKPETLKPATFSVSNLTIQPTQVKPGEAVTTSMIVTNTGHIEGSYEATLKINNSEEVTRSVTIAPGSSQTVTFEVSIDQPGIYTVEMNGLSGNFIVQSIYKLQLLATNYERAYDYITISGQVKNISNKSLTNVMAVVSYYTEAGTFVKSDDALIAYNPILPNQVSPFEVITTDNPAISRYKVEFQFLFGGTISTEDKR